RSTAGGGKYTVNARIQRHQVRGNAKLGDPPGGGSQGGGRLGGRCLRRGRLLRIGHGLNPVGGRRHAVSHLLMVALMEGLEAEERRSGRKDRPLAAFNSASLISR